MAGICYNAIKGNSQEILDWISDNNLFDFEKSKKKYNHDFYGCASEMGNLNIIKWLISKTKKVTEHNYKSIAYNAVLFGRIEILEWVKEINRKYLYNPIFCELASERLNIAYVNDIFLNVIKWLRSQDSPCRWSCKVFENAVRCEHLDAMKWLRNQNPPCPWSLKCCVYAAECEHLDLLKWLREQDPPCPWNDGAMYEGPALIGNTEMIKYLLNPGDNMEACPLFEEHLKFLCNNVIANGNKNQIEILEIFKNYNPSFLKDESLCLSAVIKGNLEILQWLRNQNPPCFWDSTFCYRCIEMKKLTILKWARSQEPPCPWYNNACTKAAEKKDLDSIDWLISNGCPYNVPDIVGRLFRFNYFENIDNYLLNNPIFTEEYERCKELSLQSDDSYDSDDSRQNRYNRFMDSSS